MGWSCSWYGSVRAFVCLSVFLGVGGRASAQAWSRQEVEAAQAEPPRFVASPPGFEHLTLPSGFSTEVVVSGLDLPTSFTRLPDGRILLAEKSGVVRVFKSGALLSTPLIDISAQVNSHHDRGLLSIAADPDFATNGYVYLFFTWDDDATDDADGHTGRLARYTVVGDTASRASETVILGTVVGQTCDVFPPGSDCFPSEGITHTVGDIAFAPDGTMFLTAGEGAPFTYVNEQALRAQRLDSLGGKVLRVTRTGQGLPDNPFWNGDPNANRSKVWALGLRNPFRFTLRPGTSIPYVGDVGADTYEEINVATKGANLGWPCFEGPFRQSGYEPLAVCQELYSAGPSAVKPPLVSWEHSVGRTAVGGAFFTGPSWPEAYRGAYFYGDYTNQWMNLLRVDANDALVPGSVATFSPDLGGMVDIEMGPDGQLYYIDIGAGRLNRIRYTEGNTPPVAVASATPIEGAPPLSVSFSSAGSNDPDGDALQYSWDFQDGSPVSSEANPMHTYATAGVYAAQLTVSDGRGGSHTATVSISVGNRAPQVTITAPSPDLLFSVGDVVVYQGSATDTEDGAIPASQLEWRINLHHCASGSSDCHVHPHVSSTGESGTLTVPDHGGDFFFEFLLTATDSQGLSRTSTVIIYPRMVQLSLQTSPSGLQVVYDGTAVTAPLTRPVIVGSRHSLHAPSPQANYTFESWSDGGAAQHIIQIGTADASYTATFVSSGPVTCPVGQYQAEYFNNQELSGPPVLVRCEVAPLAYDWGTSSPGPGVNADNFSVRWRGRFNFAAGTYTFTARADDGVRVFVDGTALIDGWVLQPPTDYTASRALTAGEHEVVMEYFEAAGGAEARLRW